MYSRAQHVQINKEINNFLITKIFIEGFRATKAARDIYIGYVEVVVAEKSTCD